MSQMTFEKWGDNRYPALAAYKACCENMAVSPDVAVPGERMLHKPTHERQRELNMMTWPVRYKTQEWKLMGEQTAIWQGVCGDGMDLHHDRYCEFGNERYGDLRFVSRALHNHLHREAA